MNLIINCVIVNSEKGKYMLDVCYNSYNQSLGSSIHRWWFGDGDGGEEKEVRNICLTGLVWLIYQSEATDAVISTLPVDAFLLTCSLVSH